jgi:serine O-acetyltransferase
VSTSDEHPFWHLVRADLYRYSGDTSPRAMFKCYLRTPGFKYTFWMRLASHLRRKGVIWRPWYFVCRAILHAQGLKYGISIPYNTSVGPGLYIGHHGGIVLNDMVVVGCDCNINHGVTIGIKYGGKTPGVPVVGDRVYLGPGCVVIGGIRLGNDVAVGANAVLLESVPDFGVVGGVPARLLSSNGSAEYVVNTRYGQTIAASD